MKTKSSIIFLLFIANNIFAQEYDINDPRNPNCPCHKMQQQADEEFAQLNNVNKNVLQHIIENNNSDDNKGDHFSSLDDNTFQVNNRRQEQSNNSMSYTSLSKKRKNVWIKKTVFRFSTKHRFKKRGKINVALCYNWR